MVCVQHCMGLMGPSKSISLVKKPKKLEKIILEINYAICLIYMLYFLLFPDKEYSVNFYDYWIIGYVYASTAILILKDLKKMI
jgi:hypothetical protein